MNDLEYSYLKRNILKLSGLDLSSYKTDQMRRRLDSYVARSGAPNVVSFCRTLDKDGQALRKLQDFMTINVSEFFRDLDQYGTLQTHILPDLLRKSRKLNIWSAGCSIGAEPYSIAMALEKLSPDGGHRILATDLDEGALEQARQGGPYRPSEVRNLDQQTLAACFTCSNGEYFINDKIKRKVEFKRHNLLGPPVDEKFHLIVCRNVTIYFADDAKNKVMQGFHSALGPGGILFVGATETLLNAGTLGFQRLSASFYQKSVPAPEFLGAGMASLATR